MSSFLDKDPYSLPKGKPFPSRIFSNARHCKVAVLVLSPEFLSSKWPMLELSEIVKARKFSNPDMAILPLFFKISVETLKKKLKKQDLLPKWKELQEEDDRINCEEWQNALKEICKFNGMEYAEYEGEVFYRDQIVDRIRLLLPPNLKYDDSLVQGKTRLCQEVAKLFEKAEWRNGVKVVGLYGIAGSGKTTISMSLCNFYSPKFKGKVFHAEFDRQSCVETQKQVLKALTDASDNLLNSVTSKEQGSELLRQRMPKHKVFMAMDNISDRTIEAAKSYLSAGFKEGSMILLTSRSALVLRRLLREKESLLSPVPFLKDEEAMGILLKLTHVQLSDLTCAEEEVARDCIKKCCFGGRYHPLALRAFGAYLFDRFGSRLLEWNEIGDFRDTAGSDEENVFYFFELSFKDLDRRYIEVFMFLALYLPHREMRMEQTLEWLAVVCDESIGGCVHVVVNNLKKKGLIEEDDNFGGVRVHDLIRDFAESKANGTWRSWLCFRGAKEVPTRFKQTLLYERFCLEGIKFTDCSFGSLPLSSCNIELFENVKVLHLESICQLTSLNLRPCKELRSLVIRDCRELKEIEGLEHLSNIAWIEVAGYNSLTKVPQIEGLQSLQRFCWECWGIEKRRELVNASLETTRLGDLRKCIFLKSICIRFQSFEEFPKLEGLRNLQEIIFRDCLQVTTGPDLSGRSQLKYSDFGGCSAMTTGPDLSGCSQLNYASFYGCSAMTTGPDLSGCSQLLSACFKGCSTMTTGPDLSGCSQLLSAWFEGCSAMTTGPDLSGCSQLQSAWFNGCSAMTTGPDLSGCSPLQSAWFNGCSAMTTGPDLNGCSQLQSAWFKVCSAMTTGPDLSGRSRLHGVCFKECSAMTTGPGCSQLMYADFEGCSAITTGPEVGACIRLNFLSLEGLERLCSFSRLTALRRLELIECGINEAIFTTNCRELEHLTFTKCRGLTGLFLSFSHFSSLRSFTLRHCEGVVDPPDVTNCRHLEDVEIRGCSGLTTFPTFAGLSTLKRVVLRECEAVEEPPDVSGCSGLQEIEMRDNPKMERLPSMVDCPSLRRLDVSWGIAVDRQRIPPQLRTCPIFRNGHSLQKHFGLYSLANKYYRFATIQTIQTKSK